MMEALHEFLNSEAGLALQGLGILAFADFATGVVAALRDGTFSVDALAAFVRKHLLGRVFPIGTMLVVGYFGGPAGQLVLGGAIAAGVAYVAETASSVLGNLNPPKESDVKDNTAAAALNPVPTE
jgi:hypothetical protein